MLDTIKKHRKTVLVVGLILFLALFGFSQYTRARSLEYARTNEYNRVFAELTEYVDDLEITLLKGQVVSSAKEMTKLSADLYGQASAAKANLTLLPLDGGQLEKTSEFLSQVGEYAVCLSDKMTRGEKLSEKEIETMRELTSYAGNLKSGLDKMLVDINEGKISYDTKAFPSFGGRSKTEMTTRLEKLEESFHNYPSLVYDGPFSQHLELKESPFLKGKPEITEKQATARAADFIGKKAESTEKVSGKLPSYIVKGNGVVAEFTKSGGYLLMLLKDRHIGEENLSEEAVRKKAETFLGENGYKNMAESYFEKRDGSIVINYAATQDGYILYPDLVKVKIALDDGEVIGFESRGYITNHTYRHIPKPVISKDEALRTVNEGLEILSITEAVIPLDNGNEACCYQIKGTVEKRHFLMFVNTQTGETEDVQILLENENGTLAV